MKLCEICGSGERVSFVKKSRNEKYLGMNICHKHRQQIYRNGKITDNMRSRRNDERICDICKDGFDVRQCGLNGNYNGFLLCRKHYHQVRATGSIVDANKSHRDRDRICEVCNKEDAIYCSELDKMLCRRHYDQVWNYGKIFERTVFDSNDIVKYDTYAEVILYNSKHIEKGRVKIDLEDVEHLSKYKWYLDTWGYASTGNGNGGTKSVMMQRLIMDVEKGEIVDHINRDTLDNRKENLRIADKSLNAVNAGLRTNNTSGVTGVSFNKHANCWRIYINYQGKRIELGYKKDYCDAVVARLLAEKEYYPEHPPQKHLFEEYGVLYDE
ncbi:HNH endonuclease [Paenibacillus sp. XY044]|uniref:HNH endonuclease n=1 Tax=Paenibacillus sp. XY044 TaxID=2026089 RepID=UPI00211B205B|nr:HNH endonuclease [Paenibacillus sp. XY044]